MDTDNDLLTFINWCIQYKIEFSDDITPEDLLKEFKEDMSKFNQYDNNKTN